jgi:hypothetical protein
MHRPCVPGRSVVQTPPRRPAGPRTHEGVASGGETHQHTKQEGSCPPILQRSKNETKEEKRDRKMQMKLAKVRHLLGMRSGCHVLI